MIYQELSLAPHLSVMENILLGVEPRRLGLLDWSAMKSKAVEALKQVGRPDMQPHVRVDRLSLADQQLVEVARCISTGCRILVLDEPTSSITARDVETLFHLIERLKQHNIGIVYISHFLEEIQAISDRFTVLRDGKTVGTGVTGETSIQDVIELMVGRQVERLYPYSPRAPGDVILEVKQVSGVTLPRDASLSLRRGEVLGIAGLIGSGRTELVRAIFGLDAIRSGSISVGYWNGGDPRIMWRQGVGMVSEDRKSEGLAVGLTIADNITLPHLRGLGPYGTVVPSRQQEVCKPLIDELSIKCRGPQQSVAELSGGNQQKVALARLLHADVDVLLLDEPTRGIDVNSKAQIYRLIDQLVGQTPRGEGEAKSILMISSYLPELMGVCDRVAVMSRGMLRAAHSTRDRTEQEIMHEAIGTESEQ
jgi:ribose transport system ATP-binding protein